MKKKLKIRKKIQKFSFYFTFSFKKIQNFWFFIQKHFRLFFNFSFYCSTKIISKLVFFKICRFFHNFLYLQFFFRFFFFRPIFKFFCFFSSYFPNFLRWKNPHSGALLFKSKNYVLGLMCVVFLFRFQWDCWHFTYRRSYSDYPTFCRHNFFRQNQFNYFTVDRYRYNNDKFH